jgi:hypothetical protein
MLIKKLSAVAIVMATVAPMIMMSLEARAADPLQAATTPNPVVVVGADASPPAVTAAAPAAPLPLATPAPVAAAPQTPPILPVPAAPAPAPVRWHNIKLSQVGKYFKNFHAEIATEGESDHVRLKSGLIDPQCASQVRIKMNEPSQDEGSTDFSLSVEVSDLADKACSRDTLKKCTVQTCLVASQIDLDHIQDVDVSRARNVKFRFESIEYSGDDRKGLELTDLPEQYGGPLLTSAEQRRIEEAADKKAMRDEIVELCNRAKKGDRSARRDLQDRLEEAGIQVPTVFFEKMDTALDAYDFQAIVKAHEKAATEKEMSEVLKKTKEFCADKDHVYMMDTCKDFIFEQAQKAAELSKSEGSNRGTLKKLLFAEEAIKTACDLNPTDMNCRVGLLSAKKARYDFASNVAKSEGGDEFYNNQMIKEARSSARTVKNIANKTRDPEVRRLDKAFDDALAIRPVGPIDTPYGQMIVPGTQYDQNYYKSSMQAIQDEYEARRRDTMMSSIGNGNGVDYRQPSGGGGPQQQGGAPGNSRF